MGAGIQIKPIGQLVQMMNQYGRNLFQPGSDTIRGVDVDTWYSPLQPVEPMGPAGTEPRSFQYWSGQNLLWTPRADAQYSAAQLRVMATYPLARICIENVKDAFARASWEIQPKPLPGEPRKAAAKRGVGDKNLIKLNRFFERPDRINVWPDWVRPLIDDMLVIDAASILVRKTFSGEVVELPTISGDMIVRYIDENGYTPMPPQPAYAQNYWGIPLVNLTTDQLIYRPRNIVRRNTVASYLYGMSPTEFQASEIEIGMERLAFVLAYYREGSIPGVVQVVPKGIDPDKIAEAMQWMNSELAGNLAARRQWRMVQGFQEEGKSDQILFSKEPLLADAFDELHIKKIAFGYGVSPQRLGKTMNRASAQQTDESSDIEGIAPYFSWLKNSVMDHLIQRVMGFEDYEIVFQEYTEPNQQKQSEILTTYVSKAVLTPNEARERLGEEPSAAPEADQLGVVTGSGFVPLGAGAVGLQPGEKKPGEGEGKLAEGGGNEGTPPLDAQGKPITNKPNGHKLTTAYARLQTAEPAPMAGPGTVVVGFADGARGSRRAIEKRVEAGATINPGKLAPQSILARLKFEKKIGARFKVMDRKARKIIAAEFDVKHDHLAKAETADETARKIMEALAAEWDRVADFAGEYLEDSALAGVDVGGLQLEITDGDMLAEINTVASGWARDRAAELVGMRRLKDGSLVANPSAKWTITETTRDKLREIVTRLFEQTKPVTMRSIENQIDTTGVFSDVRASLIARNEIARAQTQGNLAAWRESGLVSQVSVILSAEHDQDDECDEVAAGSPYPIDEVPEVPVHISCICSIVLTTLAGEDGGE